MSHAPPAPVATTLLAALLLAFAPAPSRAAEYRVVELQAAPGHSRAVAISGGRVAGNDESTAFRALMWPDPSGPVTDLHPRRYAATYAEDIDAGRVVGWAMVPDTNHALLWTGGADSAVELHPPDFQFSQATGVRGQQVVGRGGNLFDFHALLWPDATPGRVIDLHPTGYVRSGAVATTGDRQGGYATLPGPPGTVRPMLWSGTADSAVDLLPPGGFAGAVTGMAADQQVGFIGFEGGVTRATLWRGTAASAVDLDPLTGFLRTTAEATNGVQQVGYGLGPATGGAEHALLWNGSNVPLDLHAFLPASATQSAAKGIDEHGNVVGHATFSQSTRAVMWVYVPEPAASAALLLIPTVLLSRRARNT